MTSYGFVIDIGKCIGCDACTEACRDQFAGNAYPPYSAAQVDTGEYYIEMKTLESGTFPNVQGSYTPYPCMQCDNPPCKTAATNSAVYTRPDGIVIIDPKLSVGQTQLLTSTACPYGKIYWNQVANIPQKCTFCAHKVDQGMTPTCVEACPTTAILFGDLSDSSSDVAKAVASGAAPLHPEYGTKPKVYYLNLPSDKSLQP